MKKVEQLKAGMIVFVGFDVKENDNKDYPYYIPLLGSFTKHCRRFGSIPSLEMFTIDENEIPELKGIEMDGSYTGEDWYKDTIYCFNGEFYIGKQNIYRYIRPISKTFDLTNVPEHLLTDELKQYLK